MSELFTRQHTVDSNLISFGCSHTWGVGVEPHETWSYFLNSKNFGQPGVSADFVTRNALSIIEKYQPVTVYVLWPEWRRFEIVKNSVILQMTPAHPDRINYMHSHPESWLKENFKTQTEKLRDCCRQKQIELVDITLYNLIPYIDHSDRWPISSLGHHYSELWHSWVADIFKQLQTNKTVVELAYE